VDFVLRLLPSRCQSTITHLGAYWGKGALHVSANHYTYQAHQTGVPGDIP